MREAAELVEAILNLAALYESHAKVSDYGKVYRNIAADLRDLVGEQRHA